MEIIHSNMLLHMVHRKNRIEFLTSKTGPEVGKFRMLLAQDLFDESDGLLSYAQSLSNNSETIHSSEVALKSLWDLLSHSNVYSPDNILTAK